MKTKKKKKSKKRKILTVDFIHAVYEEKLKTKNKKTSLGVNVHQRILEVCCVNYASLGIKYL